MSLLLGLLLLLSTCGGQSQPNSNAFDTTLLEAHVAFLASGQLEGRSTGTRGAELARNYLVERLDSAGVVPVLSGSFVQLFEVTKQGTTLEGANVIGLVPGKGSIDGKEVEPSQRPMLLLSAHYDHLGVRNGVVYNGADDNASGVAAVLEIARRIHQRPLYADLMVALFDAEELGLRGAASLLRSLPDHELDRLQLNLNLDMVGRSDGGALHVAGLSHSAELRTIVSEISPPESLQVRFGHDTGNGSDNWTGASDHAVFHRAGVPFLYFGVEDHADYHQPTDDTEALDFQFLASVTEYVWSTLRTLDHALASRQLPPRS